MNKLSRVRGSVRIENFPFDQRVKIFETIQFIHLFSIISNFPRLIEVNLTESLLSLDIDIMLTATLRHSFGKLVHKALNYTLLNWPCHHFHYILVDLQDLFEGKLFYNILPLDQIIHKMVIIDHGELIV